MSSTPSAVVVLHPNHSPRRLMVIMHADMVGYSRMIGHDDSGTFLRLRGLRRDIIDPALAANEGTLRNTAGDALLITFGSIDQAIDAALAVQNGLIASETGCADPIQFRIGINLGDAIIDDHDMYGHGINVAARLQAACPPERICVSRSIRDHARQRRDLRFEPLGPLSLKNIVKPVEAFILTPGPPAGVLRRAVAAIPAWRVRKAYIVLAALLPLASGLATGVAFYSNFGAPSQRDQFAALTASQKAISEAIARDKGVPLSVVAGILARLEESAAAPRPEGSDDLADVQRRLEAKANEFVALRQQLHQLSGEEPKVAELRLAADTALGHGDLAGAEARLHSAATLEATAINILAERARARAAAAASLLEKSARIAAVTLRYRDAAADLGQATAIVAPFDRHEQWRLAIERAAMLRRQGDEFGDRETLTEALEQANTVLALVSRSREPLDWARTQTELGRNLLLLGNGDFGSARLEQAVAYLQAALEATPRDVAPAAWAEAQYRLGAALWRLGERQTGTHALEQAVSALQAALEVRNQATDPLRWADAENQLGLALVTLGRREPGTERLEQGLATHLAAEAEYERHGRSLDWAQSANNVGAAQASLGRRQRDGSRLEQAIIAYRDALTVRTRDRVPMYWARTMDNLGLVLRDLGEREAGTARLEEAVATFRAALEERTAARSPRDRAATERNLGATLLMLSGREAGTEHLQEAVASLQNAAAQKQRSLEPLNWAAAQHDVGIALTELGVRERSAAMMQAAIAAFDNALAERPRERFPDAWAASESGLGWALIRLGEIESGTARFEAAVDAERAALDAHPLERGAGMWAVYQTRLGVALMRLGERKDGTALLHEAATASRLVLDRAPRSNGLSAQVNLGLILRAIGERENDDAALAEAAELHRAALAISMRDQSPYLRAKLYCYLATDLNRLGKREQGLTKLNEAVAAFGKCLSILPANSTEPVTVAAQQELAIVQAELARRGSTP